MPYTSGGGTWRKGAIVAATIMPTQWRRVCSSAARWLGSPLRHPMRAAFFVALALGFTVNLYCWTNSLFSHDSLRIDQTVDAAHEIAIGRYLIPVLWWLRGWLASPYVAGLCGLVFLAGAIAAIVWLFRLERRLDIYLLSALLTVNTCITLVNATYVGYFDSMMLSLLCAVLVVVVWKKWRRGWIAAIPLALMTLALYQVYLEATVVLAVLISLVRYWEGSSGKAIARNLGMLLLGLAAAFCLYYCVWQWALALFQISASASNNSVASLGGFDLVALLAYTAKAYIRPLVYMIEPETHATFLCGALNAALFIGGVAACLRVGCRSRARHGLAVTALSFLLMPLLCDFVAVASRELFHGLMIWPWYLMYYLPAILALDRLHPATVREGFAQRSSAPCLACCVAGLLLVASNALYANQVYVARDLQSQATLSIMTRIVDRVEQLPDYAPGTTPVILIGDLNANPNYKGKSDGFARARPPWDICGVGKCYAVGTFPNFGVTYHESFWNYARFVLHLKIDVPLEDGVNSGMEPDGLAMEPFPAADSVTFQDGVVFVRLS